MAWQKHRESLLFNKNLVIADTCSLLISALFAQVLYPTLHEDNVLDSIVTAIIEYCIDTPIFLLLYSIDHRNSVRQRTDPVTHIQYYDKVCMLQESKRLLGVFSVCDVMYVVAKVFIQFQFLAQIGIAPYEAALISSLVAWTIFLFLINITLHVTRIFSKAELIWYYSLILAITIANSFIFFVGINLRSLFDNVILDVSAAVAVVAAVLIVIKQLLLNGKIKTNTKQIFATNLAGIALWFTAEVIWTYYQLGLGIANPFPSMADAFWLAGYPLIAFALWRTMQNLLAAGKTISKKLGPREHNLLLAIFTMIAVIASVVIYTAITVTYDTLPTGEQLNEFVIALAYPVLDSVLLVPVVTIIWSLRRADPLHAHWILLCSFVIMSTIGDIGFAYSELLDAEQAETTIWVWDTFFNSGYVCLAASLLWYYKFNVPLFESEKKEKLE